MPLHDDYKKTLGAFDKILTEATVVSQTCAGKQAQARSWWATVLFTRFCTTGVSLISLCPRSRFSGRLIDHYDFGSIASLTRNLLECYLALFYLCIEQIPEDEWIARLCLLQLADCTSRKQLFKHLNSQNPEIPEYDKQADELRAKLKATKYFRSLASDVAKRALNGRTPHFKKRDEIMIAAGLQLGEHKAAYHMFSTQIHSGPLAFYRMGEREQGRGVENPTEKGYIAWALTISGDLCQRSTQHMRTLFPEAGQK